MKPLLSDKGGAKSDIVLIQDENIISGDNKVAQTFSDYFKDALSILNVTENKAVLMGTENIVGKN